MLKTRLTGEERTASSQIIKLAGNKNYIAQDILVKVFYRVNPNDFIYMKMIDEIGLYNDRIELLFNSCDKNLDKFIKMIEKLHKKKVPQDQILKMKTQEEYNILVKEYYKRF